MAGIHQLVGTIVLVLFVILTVGNIMRATGRVAPWTRQLSMAAGGVLLIQYVLGFTLLSTSHSITAAHYLFALAAIVTVGLEHAVGSDQTTKAARTAAMATAGTTILVLIAYAIGSAA